MWNSVDQNGDTVDDYLQTRPDKNAAKRFFKRKLRIDGGKPRKIVTDKLRSYDVARREVAPEVIHDTSQYANRFKSTGRLRGFRVLMPLYQIYLILGGTLQERSTTEFSGQLRLMNLVERLLNGNTTQNSNKAVMILAKEIDWRKCCSPICRLNSINAPS